MNTNSPVVAPDTTSPEESHPEEGSPKDQPVVGESEAMRRVQDLLAAGKLSVSDSVVFEYYQHSFTARVMADGSLRSQTNHGAEGIDQDKSPSKLYASPSEFASAMATSIALLDDKVQKTKGKISINGWNSCTVNRRSLATIRNEMLYERKNELASLSTERVREAAPVEVTGKQSEHRLAESPKIGEASAADVSTTLIQSSQALEISSRKGSDNLQNAHHLLVREEKPKLPTYRDEGPSEKRTKTFNAGERSVSPGFKGTFGANPSRDTHPLHESAVLQTSSSPESPINPISERARTEHGDSLTTSAQSAGLHEQRRGKSRSEVCDERNTLNTNNDVAKSTKQESLKNRVAHSSQLQGNQDGFAKDGSDTKDFADITRGQEQFMKADETSTLAAEPSRPVKSREHELKNYVPNVFEEKRSQALDKHLKSTSSSRAEMDLTRESSGSFEASKDNRLESVGQRDKVCTAQRENITLQVRSSKEVSDLQQEILGDSDSDEGSFPEREESNVYIPKKRCRSPSSDENRKKTRIGNYVNPEMDDAGTRPETVEGLAFESKSLPNDNTSIEVEPMPLDPDTVEAAAIAAQIEKEEASTRARRTTRLAAGKIKQVDYKASTGLNVPRGISSEFGWEENTKPPTEIESSMEIARTTRRRTAPNQLQPPQRSSRRVAKLRNSYESSNEQTDNHSAGPAGEGFDVRSDIEITHVEDMERKGSQRFRPNLPKSDSSDRRRGRTESSSKKARYHFQQDDDPDSHGRTYNVRGSIQENYATHGPEIADLSDPDDCLSDMEDEDDPSDVEDGIDQTRPKIDDIKRLAEAVMHCESADPRLILRFLNEQDNLKSGDLETRITREFLKEVIECIQDMPTKLASQKDTTCREQLLSFLSAEIWRLITGGNMNGSGKPNSLVRRANKEDRMRISNERSRKKEHRDVEELRANLEKEMESRRRAELDTLFTEIYFCDASRAVAREKTKSCRLKQETRDYRDMERVIRGRLEGAKVLVGQLRGEIDESDDVAMSSSRTTLQGGTRRTESLPNGSFVLPSLRTANERIAEDDVVMTNKNVTTTSRRLMEMDRLRALIAAREVEAEEFQRICEKERMHFVTTLELKTRIETELYLNKSQSSVTHSFGNSSTLPTINSVAKDSLKKGDIRGSSTHTTRGPGHAKQKAGSSGKHTAALPFTNNQKLPLPGHRPKPGRAPEATKQVKRKNFGRSGGNGGNGNGKM